MAVESIDHINIRTSDVISTSKFFSDVLQMEVCETPGIPDRSMAAWLCDESGRAVVHVATAEVNYPWELDAEVKAAGSGRVHHVAFRCVGYDETVTRLDQLRHTFQANVVTEIGLRQLFVTDPNGILVELNFFGD